MIHVVVGTRHLFDILGPRGQAFDGALRRVVRELAGKPLLGSFNSLEKLKDVTVYDVLAEFHRELAIRLAEPPVNVIEHVRDEISRVARDDYHLANFICDRDDASLSLATYGLFPHGRIEPDGPEVFLPDFSVSSRCYGFVARPPCATRETLHYAGIESFLSFVRSVSRGSATGHNRDELLSRLHEARPHIKPPFAPYELCGCIDKLIEQVSGAGSDPSVSLPFTWVPLLERTLQAIDDFARSQLDGTIEHISTNRHFFDLSRIECHLCETLWDVFHRAEIYLSELVAQTDRPYLTPLRDFQEADTKQWLVLDSISWGFSGHRSLRRDNLEVPPVASHPQLSRSAVRLGMAKPIISELFPIAVWQPLQKPVKHFLLDAAEHAASLRCSPLYPSLPTEEEMRELAFAAQRAQGDCGFDVDQHAESLEKLGIRHVVERRVGQYRSRLERAEWAWDWAKSTFEFQSSLYDTDIERSLHLQRILDLYPLHKRVLGLVEYSILPKVKRKFVLRDGKLPETAKAASSLWTVAFTGAQDKDQKTHKMTKSYDPLTGATLQGTWEADGKRATLETEGHWLVNAADHDGVSGTEPLDLSVLVDEIVTRMMFASGVSVTLEPDTPSAHAQQLGRLAKRNKAAETTTLFLGKVALMLRNAVEHGTDEVSREGLLMQIPGYWEEERRYKGKPTAIPDWNRKTAADAHWSPRKHDGSSTSLPAQLPNAANTFLLTPASLQRCLVLMSLVMHGAGSHLGI